VIQTNRSATDHHAGASLAPDDASHQNQQGTDYAKQRASQAAESVTQSVADNQEELKRQAAELSQAAQQKACEAAEQAKQSGAQYAREKKALVAEEIGVFSGAIRKASSKLHEEQHDSIASYVDAAAEQLDRYRRSLESKDVGELLDDAQDFTRRHPEVVYGGLFVAGLAAMRFLKASKPQRRQAVSHRDLSYDENRPASAFGHDPEVRPMTRPITYSNQPTHHRTGERTS